jgi:hypothetical protein
VAIPKKLFISFRLGSLLDVPEEEFKIFDLLGSSYNLAKKESWDRIDAMQIDQMLCCTYLNLVCFAVSILHMSAFYPQTINCSSYTANNNSVGLLKKLQEFGSFNLLRNFFRKTCTEFFQEFSKIFSGKDPVRIHTTNML